MISGVHLSVAQTHIFEIPGGKSSTRPELGTVSEVMKKYGKFKKKCLKAKNTTRMFGISSKTGKSPILGPLLDFCLSECEVKDQTEHVDGSGQEKHIPPARLRILTDKESSGSGRDDPCGKSESSGDPHEETCKSRGDIKGVDDKPRVTEVTGARDEYQQNNGCHVTGSHEGQGHSTDRWQEEPERREEFSHSDQAEKLPGQKEICHLTSQNGTAGGSNKRQGGQNPALEGRRQTEHITELWRAPAFLTHTHH